GDVAVAADGRVNRGAIALGTYAGLADERGLGGTGGGDAGAGIADENVFEAVRVAGDEGGGIGSEGDELDLTAKVRVFAQSVPWGHAVGGHRDERGGGGTAAADASAGIAEKGFLDAAGGSGDEVGGGGGEGEEAAVLAEHGLRADVVAGSGAVGAGNERSGSGAGGDIHAGGADENLLNPQRIVGESGGVGAERD